MYGVVHTTVINIDRQGMPFPSPFSPYISICHVRAEGNEGDASVDWLEDKIPVGTEVRFSCGVLETRFIGIPPPKLIQ